MKKTYQTSQKARTIAGWHRHLRKEEKRRVNKSTRKLAKKFAEVDRILFEQLRGQ